MLVLGAGLVAALALGTVVALLSGGKEQQASPVRLISQKERSAEPAGSPARVFLDYWSNLQFSDWPGALALFAPSYLDSIGADRTVAGLQIDEPLYPTVKPRVLETTKRLSTATVRYEIVRPKSPVQRQTVSFARVAGKWRIIYDSAMDRRLRSAQQVAAGATVTGAVNAGAVRAGESAARAQARYLDSRRAQTKPRRPRTNRQTPGTTPP